MTASAPIAKSESVEIAEALNKANSFADALDQVFKKAAVTELLLMAALSHYDQASSVPVDKLNDYTRAITQNLLDAKRNLMALKVIAGTVKR